MKKTVDHRRIASRSGSAGLYASVHRHGLSRVSKVRRLYRHAPASAPQRRDPLSRRGRSFAGAELYTFSGWTNGFAKPVGYVIDGTEPYADTEIYYLFTGSTTPHSSQTTVEEIAYRMYPSGAGITAI